MAVAMGSGQLDLAWMGPWGYVLAANSTGCTALATVKYDDKPIYHAIIVGKPDLQGHQVSRRHQGHVDLVRRRRLNLGVADSDLVRQGGLEDRSEDLLEVLRRCHPRRQRNRGAGWSGGPRDRLRPQSQRDDRQRHSSRPTATKIALDFGTRCPTTRSRCPRARPKEFGDASAKNPRLDHASSRRRRLLPNRYTGFVAGHARLVRVDRKRGHRGRQDQAEAERPARGGALRAQRSPTAQAGSVRSQAAGRRAAARLKLAALVVAVLVFYVGVAGGWRRSIR